MQYTAVFLAVSWRDHSIHSFLRVPRPEPPCPHSLSLSLQIVTAYALQLVDDVFDSRMSAAEVAALKAELVSTA